MIKQYLIVENLKNMSKLCPIQKMELYNSEILLVCYNKDLVNMLLFFKNHISYQYKILTCISAIDYSKNKYRFKVVYELLSIRYNSRTKIVVFVNELLPINSINDIFSSANWYESEIWDMFGVFFTNHENLKRILTDYGFEGYPLRKDFPLTGFVEMRYSEIKKRVISESIELSQEYRIFKFLSPWH